MNVNLTHELEEMVKQKVASCRYTSASEVLREALYLIDIFIDSIDRKFRILADQPHIGRLRNELAEGLRSFPLGRVHHFL